MDVASLAIQIKTGEVQKGVKSLDDLTAAGKRAEKATDSLTETTNGLSNAVRTLAAGFSAVQLIRISDEYTKFTAQLRLASDTTADFNSSLDAVRRISTDAQSSLSETAVLFARITNGTKELGISQRQVADVTETVSLALKVSGASAAEASSAMLQLSQAFASGQLRGEEFNAVNEAAPRLMKALADGIGVPIGALREMAQEGQITSEIMARVLPQALQQLREEAKSVQTISGAFQVLKNNVLEFVGEGDRATGASKTLASAIGTLANNLDLLAAAAIGFVSVKVANTFVSIGSAATDSIKAVIASSNAQNAARAAAIAMAQQNVATTASEVALTNARVAELRATVLASEGNIQLALTTNGLIPAQQRAAAAAAAHQAALQGLATAQTAMGGAASIASRALGFLGGPIGAVTTLLGLGITAWAAYGSAAQDESTKASEAVGKSTTDIIESLDKQIAKLQARARASAALGMKGAATEAETRLGELQDQIRRAEQREGEFAGMADSARIPVLQSLTKQYGELFGRIKQLNEEQEKAAASKPLTKDQQKEIDKQAKERMRSEEEINNARIELQRQRALEEGEAVSRANEEFMRNKQKEHEQTIEFIVAEAERKVQEDYRVAEELAKAQSQAADKKRKEDQELSRTLEAETRNALMRAFEGGGNIAQAFAKSLGSIVFARLSQSIAESLASQAISAFGSGGGGASGGFSWAGAAKSVAGFFGMNFDGGGYTGTGSRSGGMDGKGGFPAILHPNETVVDHSKGQTMGGITFAPTINIDSRSDRGEIMRMVNQVMQNGQAQLVDRLQRQRRLA